MNRAEKAALAGAVALGTTAAMIRAAMFDPGGSCIGPTIGWGLMGATVGAVMGGLIAGSGPAEDAGHVTQLERSQPLTSHSREERMAGRIGHLAWIAVAVLTIGVLLPSPVSAQSPGSSPVGEGQCRPADAEADHLAEQLRRVLSSTDSADTDLRRDVGITYQPSPFVAQVSDEGVCAQAVAALNARTRTPGRARQVYVYDLGSQYAVDDPEQMAGEYRMLRVFSRQWELRGDILVY